MFLFIARKNELDILLELVECSYTTSHFCLEAVGDMEVKARQYPYLVGQVWSHFGRKLSIGMGFG